MYKSWMWKQRSYREQFQAGEGGSVGGTGAAGGGADEAQSNEGGAEGSGSDDDQGQDDDSGQQGADQGGNDGGDEEVVVMLGDEPLPASNDDEIEGKPAPQWVKDLRKQARELARENRELKQAHQAAQQQQAAPAAQVLGPKPTPEDFDFDAEKYGEALVEWNGKKAAIDAQEAAARQEREAADAAWKARVKSYETAKAALKVPDFDDAEHVVRETLSQTQQGVILHGADKPELLMYALGKNPAKAKELAGIKDPIKFAFQVAKLETQLKVAPRGNVPPAPERQVRGTAGGTTVVDSHLARLEAEADRTGDRTKVVAYKRDQKRKTAA